MATHPSVKPISATTADEPARRGRLRLPSGLTRGFRALQVRNYRIYFFGQLISLTGTWMQTTAQSWLVLQLTRSPFALGLVTTLQFLPIMLLSLVGGAVADRVPKRRLLLVTQTLSTIIAAVFGLLVASGTIQLWHIYVLAALQGTANAIDNPTRQAFAIELVGKENVVNAVALNSMLFNASRVVGPALAGLVIASIGIAPTLFANAISFLPVIAGLLMMDASAFYAVQRRARGGIGEGLREGLAYSWHTPKILLIMVVVAAIGTFGYNFSVTLPLIAGFVLHTGAAGFGALGGYLGAGSLVGAIVTAYTREVTIRRLLLGSAAFSVLLAAVAFSTVFWLSAILLVALGFAGITFATTANTLLQLSVPDVLRGRVMGLYMLLFAGSTPIGALLIGTASSRIGVPGTLLLCAVLCAVGVVVATFYWRSIRRAEQATVADPIVAV